MIPTICMHVIHSVFVLQYVALGSDIDAVRSRIFNALNFMESVSNNKSRLLA